MRLVFVTGGARSGKSDHAEKLARELGGAAVTFVATAAAGDDEMAARIARHRKARPAAWRTIEIDSGAAAAVLAATTPVVLLDCLTLLASNVLLGAEEAGADAGARVRAEAQALVHARNARVGTLIVVSNEVGLGVVPATRLGRVFRDALGEANRIIAAAADRVVLMVSGIPLQVR
jgi:adenosyl cobinamide kinase/adenosyl cobinamide phosphate guanylyltransferase